MAYLTFSEYQSYGFSAISDETSFDSIEATAESEFDLVTQSYYVKNDLAADTDANRVAIFKKALAAQCDFMKQSGITSPVSLVDSNVKSITIGRTTVQKAIDYTSIVDMSSGVCYTALNLLAQAGLLFRGVDSICHL